MSVDGLKRFWHKAFLEERPSISLCFFRLAVAFTVGAHILPTFVHLEDNYFSTAFKEKNYFFFTQGVLSLVEKSPDAFVLFMVLLFSAALFLFAIGLCSQISCILMTLGCYYFYALNSLHIGTLSYDILLVTLFLMCVTGYHGDSLSADALLKKRPLVNDTKRPIFIQRLLQLQLASTYFYTALHKFTNSGNWIMGNPMHCLFNSTAESVVKEFPFRSYFACRAEACHTIGIAVIVMELSIPFLLFIRKTRIFAIAAGFFFHALLFITLHVPTIFLFLFPPQFLLFIEPEKILRLAESFRRKNINLG